MDARDIEVRFESKMISDVLKKFSIGNIHTEWRLEKKSSVIESLLVNVPIGQFVWFGYDECINGQNRIKAIKDFVENKFTLCDLKFIETYSGKYFEELPPYSQRKILETYLPIQMISRHCPLNVRSEIISRMK